MPAYGTPNPDQDPSTCPTNVGRNIMRSRLHANLSRRALETAVFDDGYEHRGNMIYLYERGGRIPRPENLKRIARALGVKVSTLTKP